MDIKKLIEEINLLSEDELVDEFETPTIVDDVIVEERPSLTNELEAKTRISRAFDTLKDALDYFKDITAEELDLVQDSLLNSSIEQLSDDVWAIESCLHNDPTDSKVDDNIEDEVEINDDIEDKEVEEDEETEEEVSFDDEAQLDLFDDSNLA